MTIKNVREINGLVNLADMDNSFIFDLKYASKDNFTKVIIYPVSVCVLRKETALKLISANEEFKKHGYKIKIWDAYRPIYAQKIFWDIVCDDRFVANPNKRGSRHNFGAAVDITLVDEYDIELKMPSIFDDFSDRARRNYIGMNEEERKNVDFLTSVMEANGFLSIDTEWWHFDDSNYSKYEIIDVDFEYFLL